MTQLRNLGTVNASTIEARQLMRCDFVKITMPSPVGILRFTQKPGGFVGDIDGIAQTWEERGFVIRQVASSIDDTGTINAVEFLNADSTYTNYVLQYGMRDRLVELWRAWWNPVTEVFEGALKLFEGMSDQSEISEIYKLVLKPHFTPWDKKIPPLIGPTCFNPYRDPDSCQYVGGEPEGQTTCYKSRADCALRGNLLNFNGFDLLPPPGTVIKTGGANG